MIRVSAVQFAPTTDTEQNLGRIAAEVAAAVASGAELVVFPEYSSWFSTDFSGIAEVAQPLDGRFVTRLKELGAEHRVTIVAGFVETPRGEDPRVTNTLAAVGPDGALLASYRKVHLYDAFGAKESDWMRPGEIAQPQTFQLGGLTAGLQTCYDLRFPEVSRWLVDAGAELLIVPAEWVAGPDKREHWVTLCRARAIENIAFLVAADHVAPVGVGASLILDPLGHELAVGGDEDETITAELAPELLAAARARNPALGLRRFAVRPA